MSAERIVAVARLLLSPCAHALVIAHADLTLVTIFLTTRCKTSPHVVDEQDKCWRQWKTA